MKAREAHQLSTTEMTQKLREAYQEMFNLRIQKATREMTNYSRVGQVRKDIARFKTILRERALDEMTGTIAGAAEE